MAGKRFTSRRSAWLPALAVLGLVSGCITIDERAVPEGPTQLRPAASELQGGRMADVLIRTAHTVARETLDTQLIRRVAERAKKAVVSIYVRTKTPARVHLLPIRLPVLFTGIPVSLPGEGLGSGFFIHPRGYILTNNHVIQDATEIRALTRTGEDLELMVLARDPVYDLALCRVRGGSERFPVLEMGDSDEVGVGDMTIAVGNPLGLGHSVSFGIISQTGRNLSGVADEEAKHIRFLQTDTPINPGNSGGPLITLTGAWVGVNTAGIISAQNIGFAVPAKQVVEFLENVLSGEGEIEPSR